ncbi:hypothetical protein DFA_06372 [Cavenderia fasciculata]|uniref:EF-hand domain-containing protein n=1 Tax=Cavenderia fasciculata TaxID=261658 RepID=F4PKV1_CACFS|nr:uncharacterized protein DFA_06372 [Cavenderia fasciculata]EGG24225.1 hypothetical protein DFA_06372 [Cavenderia fasciculata]|eukprot:XP_004362076.1 hypothetical protein DFA_06372 [Cavenderia fasciculata]
MMMTVGESNNNNNNKDSRRNVFTDTKTHQIRYYNHSPSSSSSSSSSFKKQVNDKDAIGYLYMHSTKDQFFAHVDLDDVLLSLNVDIIRLYFERYPDRYLPWKPILCLPKDRVARIKQVIIALLEIQDIEPVKKLKNKAIDILGGESHQNDNEKIVTLMTLLLSIHRFDWHGYDDPNTELWQQVLQWNIGSVQDYFIQNTTYSMIDHAPSTEILEKIFQCYPQVCQKYNYRVLKSRRLYRRFIDLQLTPETKELEYRVIKGITKDWQLEVILDALQSKGLDYSLLFKHQISIPPTTMEILLTKYPKAKNHIVSGCQNRVFKDYTDFVPKDIPILKRIHGLVGSTDQFNVVWSYFNPVHLKIKTKEDIHLLKDNIDSFDITKQDQLVTYSVLAASGDDTKVIWELVDLYLKYSIDPKKKLDFVSGSIEKFIVLRETERETKDHIKEIKRNIVNVGKDIIRSGRLDLFKRMEEIIPIKYKDWYRQRHIKLAMRYSSFSIFNHLCQDIKTLCRDTFLSWIKIYETMGGYPSARDFMVYLYQNNHIILGRDIIKNRSYHRLNNNNPLPTPIKRKKSIKNSQGFLELWDGDGNQEISYEEVLNQFKNQGFKDPSVQAAGYFKTLDHDGDGIITINELRIFDKSLQEIIQMDVDKFLLRFTSKSKYSISIDDLIKYFKTHKGSDPQDTRSPIEKAESIMSLFDSNFDGVISLTEIKLKYVEFFFEKSDVYDQNRNSSLVGKDLLLGI